MMRTPQPEIFRPQSTEFQADPYPTFEVLREQHPLFFYEPWNKWIVTRYEDINKILRDRRFGRAPPSTDTAFAAPHRDLPNFRRAQRSSLMELDPPQHTRIRRAVQGVFTPKLVRQLQPRIAEHCHQLIDSLEARLTRQVDLLKHFAQPIPVRVIADLLGIHESDRSSLAAWSTDIIALFEPNPSSDARARGEQASMEFAQCIELCVTQKLSQPQPDLISSMAQLTALDPPQLSLDEIVANSILLLNAGHEAVVNVIGNGLLALLSRPDQLGRLKDDPSLSATAIEEMMRFDTPVPMFDRWVLEDVELCGQTVPQGEQLALYYGSANRDPEVFAHPNTFDISRDPNPHIAFGLGLHFCLGAPLARVELNTALPILLERLPDLSLAESFRAHYEPGNVFRYLAELTVSY